MSGKGLLRLVTLHVGYAHRLPNLHGTTDEHGNAYARCDEHPDCYSLAIPADSNPYGDRNSHPFIDSHSNTDPNPPELHTPLG